jgi:hypothetical protein
MAERMSLCASNAAKHPALDAAKTTRGCRTNDEVTAERNEKALKKGANDAQKKSGINKAAQLENAAREKEKAIKNQPGASIESDLQIERMVRPRPPTRQPGHTKGESRCILNKKYPIPFSKPVETPPALATFQG